MSRKAGGAADDRQILMPEARPLLFALLLLLAALLRLHRLGANSLWIDELITIFQATVKGPSLWVQFLDDVQNPLPMLIVAGFHRLSTADAWLRLPSVIFGVGAVPLLYVVTRRVVSERVAFFAAFLLAIHPLHIYHSQEVRGYAALLFFGLAATAVALGAKGRLSYRRGVALCLLGSACILSNLSGMFWMAGLALGLLVAGRLRRSHFLGWAACFLGMLLLTSQWWSASLRVHESGRVLPGAEMGEPLRGETTFNAWSLPYTAFVMSHGASLGPTVAEMHEGSATAMRPLLQEHLPWIVAAAGVNGILFCAGLYGLRRRSWEILAWILPPLAIALALAMRNVKPFNPRYVISILPALLIVLAVGMDRLRPKAAMSFLVAWLILSGVALYRGWYVPSYMHEDVRGSVELVELRQGDDDLILAPLINLVVEHYYDGSGEVVNLTPAQRSAPGGIATALAGLPSQPRYLWYLRARPWSGDPGGRLLAGLEAHYWRLGHFPRPGVAIYLYDRQRPPGESAVEP
jgi:hypothetical protein